MNKRLTIIMPCYNCADTLEEAVESCYAQDLENFEIVMVDDGSTDNTKTVMKKLADKHLEIKLFYHDKNRGGGAARNTAVGNSEAEIIFCLDSDDVLPPKVLSKMFSLMKEKGCDGVLFEETRFFYDKNIKKTEIVKNTVIGRPIELVDLFKEKTGFLTKHNFLYTKESFNNSGGYPTDHGFDTQTFGLRFLSNGHKAYVCPGAFYFHQRSKVASSYFMRECAEGKLSFNIYLMYEEIIHLLSDDLIRKIFNYDIIGNNILGSENLSTFISKFFTKKGEQDFFIKNYKTFIKRQSPEAYMQDARNSDRDGFTKKIVEAIYNYKSGMHDKALDLYSDLITSHPNSKLLYVNMLRSLLCKNGFGPRQSNDYVFQIFQSQKPKSRFLLLANKVGRLFKKLWK